MRAAARVGLIGYGYSGKPFHAPLIRSAAGLDLRIVGSGDPDRVRADLRDVTVLAEPVAVATSDSADLVVIATPNDTAPRRRAGR